MAIMETEESSCCNNTKPVFFIVIMLTVVCEYIAPSKVTCQNKTETKQKQKPATHGQNQFCDLLLIHVHINMGVFIHRLSVFDFLSVLSVEG